MVEREHRHRREIQRLGGAEIAAGTGEENLAGVGPFEPGGEPEQFALAAAIFADNGNERAVGGGSGKLVERRKGGFAELNGHLD